MVVGVSNEVDNGRGHDAEIKFNVGLDSDVHDKAIERCDESPNMFDHYDDALKEGDNVRHADGKDNS